jgi:hypothetical protein
MLRHIITQPIPNTRRVPRNSLVCRMKATEEADLINSNPIKEGLVAFRQPLQSAQAHLGFDESLRSIFTISEMIKSRSV